MSAQIMRRRLIIIRLVLTATERQQMNVWPWAEETTDDSFAAASRTNAAAEASSIADLRAE